ncbi:CusA/CzcA family heavy metal efflux RND transporter [Sphingobacterium sp.]|uniref:CusA/CzcA family heavy metal efflux RND transporter n=1 Tax=Sphingobacterium sp. TaxID=341027 RepID=UPI0028982F56|nr:CusA/CzcA family heavy metal efflux RND transporter [Sphingobacterium sp.]
MLDKIIRFSIQNKLIVGMIMLGWIVWGVWSLTRLPIDAVPDITNNQVQIITLSPTLATQEVEQFVTFPIEQAIANVPNTEEIRSISRFGLSVITVVFKEEVDIYFARQLLQEKLKEAEEEIPDGVGRPELAPVSTGLGEVYQYILHPKEGAENKYTTMDLRTMQDWIVRRQLNGTPGVAEVNSFGGLLKQYEVSIDPERLRAYNLSIADVYSALEQNNQNTGGAYIDKKPTAYYIRGVGMVTSLDDVKQIAIIRENQPATYIRDIADVKFGSAVRYGAMTYNGKVDAVGGVVMMLKGENSKEVVDAVKRRIATIQKTLPKDVTIEPYLDRTDLVERAISTVEKNLIEGALIVIFVLVIFLGNLRAGLIVASAIPLSMLFAISLMNVFGVSANLMSLGAIDFGLIVDGSVIIVEATLHHLATRGLSGKLSQKEMDEEVYQSASKIRSSAAFGEIIILIVYIPILVLRGVEGKMFVPMAQTVSFAIIGALILSLTYIPMMCALFLPKQIKQKETFSTRMINWLYLRYEPILHKAFDFKGWIVGITVAVFGISVFFFSKMGGEFLPTLKEGDYAFHCILPKGTSLNQSIETSMLASRIIKSFDEVKMVVGKTGSAEVPTDPMPPEATDIMVILNPKDEWTSGRTYDELGDAIYAKLKATIPGVFFEKNQPIQMRSNELMTGIRQDVAVKVFGENIDSLLFYGNKVSEIIKQVPGASTPQMENISGLPQITVEYDRVRLANNGVSVQEVNDIIAAAFAGRVTGSVYENERKFDLVVRLNEENRQTIDNVANLFVPTKAGVLLPLSELATVAYKNGPAQISREEGKRRVVIGFNITGGRDVASVVKEIQDKMDKQLKLTSGYYLQYAGSFQNLEEANARLSWAVPLALLLIFFLLYTTFKSVKQALLIFTAIPMSAIGGVFALMLRGMPFSISAGIGFIALFGVAVLNGIVLIGTFNHLKQDGMKDVWQRIKEGTKERFRPVLMTASVASLGFLPMAISQGDGAEVQKPLATVVIGGLITATILTLIVLPILYSLFERKWKVKPNATAMLIFFVCASSVVAQAQNIEKTAFVQAGLANNAAVQAASRSVEARRALIGSAGSIAKTNLSAQLGQYNSEKFDQNFELSQEIPFPTVFKARRTLFEKDVLLAETDYRLFKNMLALQLANAYEDLSFAYAREEKLKRLDSLYAEFERASQVKFQAGDIPKIQVTTAKTKRGEAQLQLRQQQVLIENLKEQINAFTNDSLMHHIDHPALVVDMIDKSLQEELLVSNPELGQIANQIERAEAEIGLEKQQSLPDFTIGYANTSFIGSDVQNGIVIDERTSRDRFHSANIGVAIPIFNTGAKSRIKSIKLEQEANNLRLQQRSRELKSELNNNIKLFQQQQEQYKFYRLQGLQNAADILNAGRLGYEVGDMDYIEYLTAIQNAITIEMNYIQSIYENNQTVNNIRYIIGNHTAK